MHAIVQLVASLHLVVLSAWGRHQSHSTNEKSDSTDHEEFGMALLQRHMQIQSTNSSSQGERQSLDLPIRPLDLQQDSQKPPSKLLIMILSCRRNYKDWPSKLAWAQEVHPGGDVLIVAGRPARGRMDTPYELDLSRRTLMVNTSDTYDGLAVKIFEAYRSIYEAPELAHVTYVYKIDDTSIPGDLADYNISGFNGTEVQGALAAEPGDYLASEWGYAAVDCANYDQVALEWHFGRVPKGSYWDNRRQPCNGVFTYGNGAFGYMLSRRALGLISKHWPPEAMDEFYHQFVYEDLAVGQTLRAEGVTPTPVHLAGHYPWNTHICPCTPSHPSEECNSWCDEHQPTHNCCHSACRVHPNLCANLVYA